MNKILAILGPTATGKTDIAINLAKKFNGELIACDSRQVYKRLDIGTGKLPDGQVEISKHNKYWIVNGVKIWMYDMVSLERQYTVADYVKDTEKVIKKILDRGKMPIIVGGTGLYLKALIEGLSNLSIPINKQLRGELENLSIGELQEKLKSLSPLKFKDLNNSDKQNPRRLLRAIELVLTNPYVETNTKRKLRSAKWNTLKIGLTASREILYKNVNSRILEWFSQGIVEEVETLMDKGTNLERFKQLGLEYGLISEYIKNGKNGLVDDLITKIKGKLHGYIRRQLTWFKKEKEIIWFDITDENYLRKIEKTITQWYD